MLLKEIEKEDQPEEVEMLLPCQDEKSAAEVPLIDSSYQHH